MPGHGIAAPQGLEGVQAEALGLVLHQHLGHPQPTGQVVQSGERGGLIARDGAVEDLGRLLHLQASEGQLLRGNGPRPVHTVLKLHGMPPLSFVRCLDYSIGVYSAQAPRPRAAASKILSAPRRYPPASRNPAEISRARLR